MSCQTKPGPAAFCSFIEDVYQEKVTQADWHAIRELAAADKGVIKLSRARCDVGWRVGRCHGRNGGQLLDTAGIFLSQCWPARTREYQAQS